MSRKRKKRGFRMPYGLIGMGGVLMMIVGPIFFSDGEMLGCFVLGLLVVVVAFTLAACRQLEKEHFLPWWW